MTVRLYSFILAVAFWLGAAAGLCTLNSCVGSVSESPPTQFSDSLGQSSGTNYRFGRVGVGTSLRFTTDELEDSINEFNGALKLQLPVWRLAEHSGQVTYHDHDQREPSRDNPWLNDYASGLPHPWDRPWIARVTFVQHRLLLEHPDGTTEPLFDAYDLPADDDHEAERFPAQTASFGTWRREQSAPGSGPSAYNTIVVTSASGDEYRFTAGCFSYLYDPGEYSTNGTPLSGAGDDGHCEAVSVKNTDGDGMRIEFYGRADTSATNDTFIPRVIESFIADGAIVTGRVYFYLRDQVGVDGTLPPAPPADRTNLSFPSCPNPASCVGFPRARDVLIGAISYPGPASNPLVPDASWLKTVFDWSADDRVAIRTEFGEYRFYYGDPTNAEPGPNVVDRVVTASGQTLRYDWTPVHDGVYMASKRTITVSQAPRPTLYSWSIYRVAGGLHDLVSVVVHPSGMSTLSFFNPALDSQYNTVSFRRARAGLIGDRYVFDSDIWATHGASIQARQYPSALANATRVERFGWSTYLHGVEPCAAAPSECVTGGWLTRPAFEVVTQFDRDTSPIAAHSVVTQHRANRRDYRLRSFSDNQRQDYDLYGHSPFRHVWAGDNVSVSRPTLTCGYSETECNGGGSPVDEDDFPDSVECYTLAMTACTQDAVTGTVDETESYQRYAYGLERNLKENSTGALPNDLWYYQHGLGSPATEVRSCMPPSGSLAPTCNDAASGLLLRAEYSYSEGRLGRVTRTDGLNPANISTESTVYNTAGSSLTGPRKGTVRQRSVRTRDADATADHVVESYEYSGLSSHPTVARVQGRTERAAYNHWGLPTQRMGANGETTHYCYDPVGRVFATYGPTATFAGCPASAADALLADEVVRYGDATEQRTLTTLRARRGDKVFETQRLDFFDGLGRNYHSQQSRVGDNGAIALSTTTEFIRDTSLPSLATVAVAVPGTVTWTSPLRRNTTAARTETSYDALNRPIATRTIHANGVVAHGSILRYGDSDPALPWNEDIVIDATNGVSSAGRETRTSHDAFGRLVSTTNAGGGTITQHYDALGRVDDVQQADGLHTVRSYDGLGRLLSQRTPESGLTSWTYAPSGEVLSMRNADGVEMTFSYDAHGRVTKRYRGAGARRVLEVELTYDGTDSCGNEPRRGLGRITRAQSEAGVFDYCYGIGGDVTRQSMRLVGLAPKELTRTYDPSGSLIEQNYQDIAGGTSDTAALTYTIDGPNYEVTGMRFLGDDIQRIAYDERGAVRTVQTQHRGAVLQTEDYVIDDFGRLLRMNDPAALGNDLFSYRLGYEAPSLGAAPRRDGLPSEIEWATRASNGATRAAYLISATLGGDLTRADFVEHQSGAWQNVPSYDLSVQHSYGANGLFQVGLFQSLSRTDAQNVVQTTSFVHDATTRRLRSTTGAAASSVQHNLSGQVTASTEFGQSSAFGYSSSGRPRYVADGRSRIAYSYDHLGQQTIVTSQEWASPCPATGGVDAEGNVVTPANDSPPTQRSRALGCYVTRNTRHIVRDPDGATVAEYNNGQVVRLPMSNVGYYVPDGAAGSLQPGRFYEMRDHVGSLRVVYNEEGHVIYRADYDPFGQALSGRTEVSAPMPFASFATYARARELNAALDVSPARFYSPTMARFMAPDPLAQQDPTHHAYAYAGNAPHAFNDPSGLTPPDPEDGITLPEVVITAPHWGELPGDISARHYDDVPASPSIFNARPIDDGYRGPTMGPITEGQINTLNRRWDMHQAAEFREMRRQQYTELAFVLLTMGGVRAESAKPIPPIQHFALGISGPGQLQQFAWERKASTFRDFPSRYNWGERVIGRLEDPQTIVHFNLDGSRLGSRLDVWRWRSGYGGPTDFELREIHNRPHTWERIRWWHNGEIVPNPFLP